MERPDDCFWCGNDLNDEGVCTHCASIMQKIRDGLAAGYRSRIANGGENKTTPESD